MAERRPQDDLENPRPNEDRTSEHSRVRSETDAPHNRGADEAVEGDNDDIDPDSAESDVDRDDTVTD